MVDGVRTALRDSAFEARMVGSGYVVVDDFLGRPALEDLRSTLDAALPEGHDGIVFSNEITDSERRSHVEQEISRVVGPPLLDLLASYRLVASLFVLKQPHGDSRRIWHADPALVDERHFRSVSAWCPLGDIDEVNGAFTVVEGSHREVPEVRGGIRVQGLLFPSEPEVEELCQGARVPIAMTAGQALLYDHRLAHGSPPNRSGSRRWAVNVPGIPVEAPLIHYIREADGGIDVYQLPNDYFYDHNAAIPVAEDPRAHRIASVDPVTGDWFDSIP